jgi:hypothetical protein
MQHTLVSEVCVLIRELQIHIFVDLDPVRSGSGRTHSFLVLTHLTAYWEFEDSVTLFIENICIQNELPKPKFFLLLPFAHQSLGFRVDTHVKDCLPF